MLFHRLALVALTCALAFTLLHRFDAPPRLPLVEAGLSICVPLPAPPESDNSADDAPLPGSDIA